MSREYGLTLGAAISYTSTDTLCMKVGQQNIAQTSSSSTSSFNEEEYVYGVMAKTPRPW